MRKTNLILVLASAVLSTAAFGQAKQQEPISFEPMPNSQGVKIVGNTNINAENRHINGWAHLSGKVAKNTASDTKSGAKVEDKKTKPASESRNIGGK